MHQLFSDQFQMICVFQSVFCYACGFPRHTTACPISSQWISLSSPKREVIILQFGFLSPLFYAENTFIVLLLSIMFFKELAITHSGVSAAIDYIKAGPINRSNHSGLSDGIIVLIHVLWAWKTSTGTIIEAASRKWTCQFALFTPSNIILGQPRIQLFHFQSC